MGGIKNKLSKLSSNKVKNLFNSLPLAGRADEMTKSSQSREENNKTKSKSFGFCHLIRQTSPATFPVKGKELGSLWVRLGSSASGTASRRAPASRVLDDTGSRRLTEGSLSAGLNLTTLTKYLGLTCLSLAIVSTLILNIISSYSNSHIESNAEPLANVSTLANDACDNTNINAPSCISLSITSSSSSTSTGGDDTNLSLRIPREGGIATGRHTVSVSSNNVTGYEVALSASEANNDETSLVNTAAGSYSIPTTTGTITANSKLANNTWGYALTDPTGHESDAVWAGLQPSTNKTAIATTNSLSGQTDTYSVYYGVRVGHPEQLLAGNYTAEVVYTATANEVPAPSIDNIAPSSITVDNKNATIAINGSHLLSTYDAYVDMGNTTTPSIQACNNLTVISNNQITCTLPEFTTTGEYVVVIQTQGGSDSYQIVVTPPAPKVTSISPDTVQTGASKREEITLTGENLEQVQSVFIDFNKNSKKDDGEECLELDIVSDSMATCIKPSGDTEGAFTVYLVSSTQSIITAGTLTYIYIGQPTITSASPYRFSINVSQPGTITIQGQNLLYTDSVFVDLNENGSADSWEECTIFSTYATQVRCMAPESNIMGQFTLYLTTPGGRSQYNYIYYN